MLNWIKSNKKSVIRGMFLVPIILVMIISISHVVSWYDLSNPLSWSIYLSIAIEIAAMSSISAASVKIKGGVWFVFAIVTLIQFIGNIFFSYKDIDVTSQNFKDWVELTEPVFSTLGSDTSDVTSQRRWLALLSGGLLPLISLASLHFFIKYGGADDKPIVDVKTGNIELPKEPLPIKEEVWIDTKETIEPTIKEQIEVIEPPIVETITEPIVETVEPPIEVVEPIITEDRPLTPEEVLSINAKKKIEGRDRWG